VFIHTAAVPEFESTTLSGLTANSITATNASKRLVSSAFATTTGMSTSVSVDGATTTINTPQDLQTTAAPTFAGLAISGASSALTMNCLVYQTGTVSQAGFTVTGTGTAFTAAMVGGLFMTLQ
jgi:hypothetical protein